MPDILMIKKAKTNGQFQLHGYSEPHRVHRNGNGGEIFLFVREDIPSKTIKSQMRIEKIFVELILRRTNSFYGAPIILNALNYNVTRQA